MQSFHMTEESVNSAEEALSMAVSDALSSCSTAERAHIMVDSIVHTAHGWRASVSVVFEPASGKHETPEPTGPVLVKPGNDDAEKVHQHEHEVHVRNVLHHRDDEQLVHEMDAERHAHQGSIAYRHMYLPLVYEDIVRAVAPSLDITSMHIIASGSLWDAVKRYQPDLEMFEAAHDISPAKPAPSEMPSARPAHTKQPSRNLKYARVNELVDE